MNTRERICCVIVVSVASVACGGASSSELAQAEQLRAAVKDPATINDKLFILWEYGGALRERTLAIAVLAKTVDPDVRALATLVRDGHQLGMDAMKPAAAELHLTLPDAATDLERAAIEAAAALPSTELDTFFLRRQRAMHAWDVTVFDDYHAVAVNDSLKRYVAATRQPLREHAALVVKLANRFGIAGGLAELRAARP
jgi:hypothetical protein